MLDLKKIEEEIDALLAKETKESLNSWFLAQNPQNINSYLGTGEFLNISLPSISITIENLCKDAGIIADSEISYPNNTKYAMAA
ncbi:MAG TPA: hypothetical protein VK622_00125 [Puia sp.]|nr:hypothetical protein [Puia sp.]